VSPSDPTGQKHGQRPCFDLDDSELVRRVSALHHHGCETLGSLLVYLGEMDRRRLYANAGFDSMHAWCVRKLGMSDQAAFKRVRVARLCRKLPAIIERVRAGSLHLSGLVVLCPHLTDANYTELLDAAAGKTRREIERLLAVRSPKPDAPTSIRRLPARRPPAGPALPVVAPQAEPSRDEVAASSDRRGDDKAASTPHEDRARPRQALVTAPAPSSVSGTSTGVARVAEPAPRPSTRATRIRRDAPGTPARASTTPPSCRVASMVSKQRSSSSERRDRSAAQLPASKIETWGFERPLVTSSAHAKSAARPSPRSSTEAT